MNDIGSVLSVVFVWTTLMPGKTFSVGHQVETSLPVSFMPAILIGP